jgi:hypothetical protein
MFTILHGIRIQFLKVSRIETRRGRSLSSIVFAACVFARRAGENFLSRVVASRSIFEKQNY